MKKTVVIDDVTYTSRAALERAIKARLPRDAKERPTTMAFDDFWTDLVAGHGSIFEKFALAGNNPKTMAYRLNPITKRDTELGFVMGSGEFMPFSWHRAAEGHFPPKDPNALHRADVISGMRRSIQPQIAAFRATLPCVNGEVQCAATGEWFPANQIDIDHHPIEFATLAKDFLEAVRLDWGGLPEIHKQNSGHPDHNRIKNPIYEAVWIEWHEEHASYQPLSKAAHYAKKKGGSK